MEKRGRKSKYESHVLPHLKEIEKWCERMTEKQIAKKLGVAQSSWSQYKKDYPELSEAIKRGRTDLVEDLHSALIKKAKGFKCEVTRAIKCKTVEYENGKRLREKEEVVFYKEEQYFPPDTAALNLALKNYDPENWANDPQMIAIRKEELKLRKKQVENNEW